MATKPDSPPPTPSDPSGVIAATPPGNGDLTDSGADLKAIPLAVNRQVLRWIDYFQGQGRPHMERYLSRSSRYMPIMKSILRKEGLPEDLIYIALIESGFSSSAKSSASAVGYWQFIKGTGNRYGLRIDSYVDERRDFIKSTQAAAGFFKVLYDLFGVWYLAIASYNVGENRVKNVVTKYHTRDFWQLARENKLPEETSNYVPKFIAARLIAKDPEKYGFTDIDYLPPVEFSEVEFKTAVDIKKLATELKLDYDDLRDLNPSYKRGVAPLGPGKSPRGPLVLRVPKGLEAQAQAAAENIVADSRATYVTEEDYSFYRVRAGDNLATIASKFQTSQKTIRKLNHMKPGARLASGRRIRVPAETTVGGLTKQNASELPLKKASRTARASDESATDEAGSSAVTQKSSGGAAVNPPSLRVDQGPSDSRKPQSLKKEARMHTVRKGETLMGIAKKYHVSLRRLAKSNNLNRKAMVKTGTELVIP